MSEAGAPVIWRLDDLRIDLARQTVERGGETLSVGGLSFHLLRYLLAQGDRVVGFDELIAHVWAPAVVNEETITQRVKLLRKALGDDGRNPRYLRSVRGQGYQLCVAPTPLGGVGSATHATDVAAKPRRARLWAVFAGIATVALVGAAIWYVRRTPTPAPIAAAGTAALLQRAGYYAGIGQRDNNERAIALYLRALQESPGQLDATLGLSRAYSARVCLFNFPPVWAERAQKLAEGAIGRAPRRGAAYAALGYSFDCRGYLDSALRGYEEAVKLNPADDNSRASAGYLYERKGRLADALIANTSLRGDPARLRFLPLQLASNLDLLGYPQSAEVRYRRSFELYPDNVFSNIAWPRFLLRQGRLSEAKTALDEALQRGTAHVDLDLLAAELALLRGDRAQARDACLRAVALRPQSSLPTSLARIASGHVDAGWARSRAQTLSQGLQAGAGYPGDWLEVALLREAAGDRAAALGALRQAVDGGYRDAAYLQVSPWFRGMNNEPAFARSIDDIHRALVAERAMVPPGLIARLAAAP